MASFVSLQELASFHSIDRQVYAKLVRSLRFDPNLSKQIVAFWYWLEIKGNKNFIDNVLYLPDIQLYGAAMETIACLDYMKKDWNFVSRNPLSLSFMHAIVSQDFSFSHVYADRENCKLVMQRFSKDVCDKVFVGINQGNLVNGFQIQPVVAIGSYQVPSMIVNKANHVRVMVSNRQESQVFPQDRQGNGDGCNSLMGNADRTLFITFSKGHPIKKEELRDLIERTYGECVEAIHMRSEPEPLFARVVVNSVSSMEKILGEKSIVKLSINGKDVWLRHFTPKYTA